MKTMKLAKKSLAVFALFAFAVSSFGIPGNFSKVANAATTWDVSGAGDLIMSFEGSDYTHNVNLTQSGAGAIDGTGTSGAYAWDITSGSIEDNDLTFDANYTATADAVTPQTVLHVEATIAPDGSLSGTWSDNYQGGARSGEVSAAAGFATELAGSLAAEDFGVMDASGVKGYTAGFGLTDATFEDAQSVIIKLYSGATLLQTNTLNGPNASSITGAQISSPFDVFGTFDYVADGYWSNAREAEYGQTLVPTKVVATVVLENGKEVTAENTNLTGDPETIFPEGPATVKVTIMKHIDGAMATALSANNTSFPMVSSWDAENIGAGSGSYSLAAGNPTAYTAVTADMTSGADYSTNEVTDTDAVGTSCLVEGTDYALIGYTTGDTMSAAEEATPSMTSPAFTNITSDKFVIVWNDNCATDGDVGGDIGGDVVSGDGVLEVTSIETLDSSAIANGNFEDGWEYVFNITVPSDEPDLAMKFSNWLRTGGSETIPAANNIRISSPQANNGGATVLITAADTYSSPDLHMTGDLNPSLDGKQIQVKVEVRIPVGTTNGSYATHYGVQSL
ncbi:MAG: hypothetical protein WAV15_00490 [Minisyncoccia bacterium]